ncbi:hypothetical protein [Kitasatospora purpeofusca]|uniref:RNA-binding protein n=1 Tax=Kitasatospora purpeofusca TaxID=67352 RepID=A0ABZ1TWS5_9ACTN|nr:hypothetical protein [Kitasatospora purpeofusca]
MAVQAIVSALHFSTTAASLKDHFAQFNPTEAFVATDRGSGKSKGHGSVTFPTTQDLEAAITALDNSELHGRTIKVDRASEPARSGGAYGSTPRTSGRAYGAPTTS